MADKEATVFVIDMGASMGKTTQGRTLNNLDWVMQYVWDKIITKVRDSQVKSLTERCFQGGRLMLLVSLDFVRTVSPLLRAINREKRTMSSAERHLITTSWCFCPSNSIPFHVIVTEVQNLDASNSVDTETLRSKQNRQG
jgi:hypothetical protein